MAYIPKGISNEASAVIEKCVAGLRITCDEAAILYNDVPLGVLSQLAVQRKGEVSGEDIFYIKNFHVEPTNICQFNCKFCSFRKNIGQEEAWDLSLSQIECIAKSYADKDIREVHIVGGVNPNHDIYHYEKIIKTVKHILPQVSIKAYSAIEHISMADKAGMSFKELLELLKDAGMDTITGGGAEIFNSHIREQICSDKAGSDRWLEFHRAAHMLDIKTNATMLYGHIETIQDRIDHMDRLRQLQDKTNGFNAFIPLKYRNKNNSMSYIKEVSIVDDLKTLALARLFLDNVPHIKAYHPMYGSKTTEMALLFGADDIDGTVEDTTKIYTMAGADAPISTVGELVKIVENAGFKAAERDTFYNKI